MSTFATVDPSLEKVSPLAPLSSTAEAALPLLHGWEVGEFAREQLQRLVRQVFLAPRVKPVRYAAFLPVDRETEIGALCLQAGQILAEQMAGSVCVAAGDPRAADLGDLAGLRLVHPAPWKNGERFLRSASNQLSSNLWLASTELFRGERKRPMSGLWMEGKMSDLRREFDYAVIHAPAAGCSDADVLGQLSDAAVLVIEAERTRRIAARAAKDRLISAGVRVLGTVLCERRFPIPQRIYRNL